MAVFVPCGWPSQKRFTMLYIRRRKAKSSKSSRSKGNNLPPTKWFDFTMVDDDFEELQLGFAPKETNADTKKCVKLFKDWASELNEPSQSSTIKMVPNDNAATPRSRHPLWCVLSNCLADGRLLSLLRECLEDMAINSQPAHSTIQTTAHFQGGYFW